MSTQVRILSIDGGGVRGLIPAVILERLQSLIDVACGPQRRRLADCFDLICGTSTGALIAAGIAADTFRGGTAVTSPSDIVRLYCDYASKVFAGRRAIMGRGIFRPKYLQGRLAALYSEIFADARLSTARTNLLIPAYEIGRPGVFFFRGGPKAVAEGAEDFFLRDVLLAATAVPFMFTPVRVASIGRPELHTLMDGGIYASNPALHAYVEGRHLFGAEARVFMLSLGTGVDAKPLRYHETKSWGLLNWISPRLGVPIARLFMNGQSDGVQDTLRRLIPDRHAYLRLDFHSPGRLPNLDDTSSSAIRGLRAAAYDYAASEEPTLALIARNLTAG